MVPLSTSPLTAILFAIDELTELEVPKLLDVTTEELDATTEDATEELETTTEDATEELDELATEEGAEEEDGANEEELTDDSIAEELERLLLDRAICELLPPTIPQGAGCEAQVVREIQLLLFS